MIEYWNVCTRPLKNNGLGQTTDEAYQDYLDLCEIFTLLPEPQDISTRWLDLVRKYSVKGKQVHDARMTAFAWSYDIPIILTLNFDDYERYSEIAIETPHSILRKREE